MKNLRKQLVLAVALAGVYATSAQAALLTSDTLVGPTVIDFSSQTTVVNVPGPIQVGTAASLDIEANGSPNTGLYTNFNGWGLGNNGTWGGGKTYISVNDARPGSLTFHFGSGPVSAVGAFVNHAPAFGTDLFVRAYDSGLNLLEEYDITTLADIDTPSGFNAGAFRGISRATADISYFEVFGYVPVIDDLTFNFNGPGPSVPAPGALALLGVGILGLGLSRRRPK